MLSFFSRTGYFPINELNTFRKIDSRLQGHPTTHEGLPGIRVAIMDFTVKIQYI